MIGEISCMVKYAFAEAHAIRMFSAAVRGPWTLTCPLPQCAALDARVTTAVARGDP